MRKMISGEFEAYEAFRDAGIHYLRMTRHGAASAGEITVARIRYQAAHALWQMMTAEVDGEVELLRYINKAA